MREIIIIEGVDKTGKTYMVKELIKKLKTDNYIVIKNPDKSIQKYISDTPLLNAGIFIADITNNWNKAKRKMNKDTKVIIDRWYASTYAYQASEIENYHKNEWDKETALITLEDMLFPRIEDFFKNQLGEGDKLFFVYLNPNWKEIEMRIQAEGTNTEPLSKKYEKLEFLKKVHENYQLFFDIIRELFTNVNPDVDISFMTVGDDTIKVVGSVHDELVDVWESDEYILNTVIEDFLPYHEYFSLNDFINFCRGRIGEEEAKKLLESMIAKDLVTMYRPNGVFTLYIRVG